GALTFGGEGDFLVGPFYASLDPTLLRGIGDVHELDPKRLAISAAKDGENFAQRAEFKPEHAVETDLAVVIGFREAIGGGVEIFLVVMRLQPKRVEIGIEVPARSVGADQHQGANRIARRLLDLGRGQLDAIALCARLHFIAERALYRLPVAIERGHEFAAGRLRPVWPLP